MPLTRRQIIELARAIEERRTALAEEIRRDVARSRAESYADTAGSSPDLGDEAVADLLADVATAEVTRDLGELRALEAAHKRLANGTYGSCIDCGDDIAPQRLQVEPEAARCIGCQERHEKTFRS
jgi:DnaK suppressor protein